MGKARGRVRVRVLTCAAPGSIFRSSSFSWYGAG